MPTYTYQARKKTGEILSGTVHATDRRAATLEVEKLGYFPLKVDMEATQIKNGKKDVSKAFSAPGAWKSPKLNSKKLRLLTQQLSNLLKAGMTLAQALRSLQRQMHDEKLKGLLLRISEDLTHGQSLSSALGKHPRAFPRFYVNLVKAGETSGALPEVLERLVKHYDQIAKLQSAIVGALAYPLVIVSVGFLIMGIFIGVILPKFMVLFSQLGVKLPLATRVMVQISSFINSFWWVGIVLAVGFGLWVRQVRKTDEGRLWMDRRILQIPLVKDVIIIFTLTHLCRTLSTLLTNGIPLLPALSVVQEVVGNSAIAAEIARARERITDGSTLSGPLSGSVYFPSLMIELLTVGEQSGQMSESLNYISELYEEELTHKVNIFTAILGPIVLTTVAGFVFAMFYSIIQAVLSLQTGIR